jgi:hypothetical protein
LVTGPTPAGLDDEAWYACRADHLAAAYGVDRQEGRHQLASQETQLRRALPSADEVVFWFGRDFFCQIHLLNLVAGLGRTAVDPVISVIDAAARCLGELPADRFRALYPARRRLGAEEIAGACAAWQACTSPDPAALDRFLAEPEARFHDVVRVHRGRFPSRRSGLGRIEELLLGLVVGGTVRVTELRRRIGAAAPDLGYTDAQLGLDLRRMSGCRQPLLAVVGAAPDDAEVTLTAAGTAVLDGRADFIAANGIDEWVGGAHLTTDAHWRRDPDAGDRLTPVAKGR